VYSAWLGLESYTEAVNDLQRAQKLVPSDATVSNKLAEARKLVEDEKKKQTRRFARLFAEDDVYKDSQTSEDGL
jgi:hypothetical protein